MKSKDVEELVWGVSVGVECECDLINNQAGDSVILCL